MVWWLFILFLWLSPSSWWCMYYLSSRSTFSVLTFSLWLLLFKLFLCLKLLFSLYFFFESLFLSHVLLHPFSFFLLLLSFLRFHLLSQYVLVLHLPLLSEISLVVCFKTGYLLRHILRALRCDIRDIFRFCPSELLNLQLLLLILSVLSCLLLGWWRLLWVWLLRFTNDWERPPLRYYIALLVFEGGTCPTPAERIIGLHLLQLLFFFSYSLLTLKLFQVFRIHRCKLLLLLILVHHVTEHIPLGLLLVIH